MNRPVAPHRSRIAVALVSATVAVWSAAIDRDLLSAGVVPAGASRGGVIYFPRPPKLDGGTLVIPIIDLDDALRYTVRERLERRTKQDIEMMKEIGYCNGIENYSRYLTGRAPGEPPYTLIDYYPRDFLLVIDESHVTIPQLHGMYNGDHSRKVSLVDNGFRLPSAYDNRPLKFPEFEKKINQAIFTSATPGKFEKVQSSKFKAQSLRSGIAEQIIRPTGLIDPELVVKSAKGQVKDVLEEIKKVVEKKERVLITTLTKKMAEDLSEFLRENIIKSEYLHSSVDTLERIRILENLRRGKFDVLVGVNLLREGLDLPEVSLVAILDADKEGFLGQTQACSKGKPRVHTT